MERISEKEIKKLMDNPGKCVGELIKSTFLYIENTKGKEALESLEKEMAALGQPINHKEINPLDWYPIGLRALTFISLRRVFGWQDEDLEKLGEASLNYSIFFKMFLKFFISLENIFKYSSKYWRKHFNFGRLEPYQFNKAEKYLLIRIYDFVVHPDSCIHMRGYFKKLAKLAGKKNVNVIETKCIYRGDDYHEYKISWQEK